MRAAHAFEERSGSSDDVQEGKRVFAASLYPPSVVLDTSQRGIHDAEVSNALLQQIASSRYSRKMLVIFLPFASSSMSLSRYRIFFISGSAMS